MQLMARLSWTTWKTMTSLRTAVTSTTRRPLSDDSMTITRTKPAPRGGSMRGA